MDIRVSQNQRPQMKMVEDVQETVYEVPLYETCKAKDGTMVEVERQFPNPTFTVSQLNQIIADAQEKLDAIKALGEKI